MRGRKGFTIAETVIAFALLAIVAGTAITMVVSSNKTARRMEDRSYAVNLCDNTIAVFCSATESADVTKENFFETFKVKYFDALGINLNELDASNETVFYLEDWAQSDKETDVTCTLKFSFESNVAKIEVTVAKDGSEVYKADYEKNI